MDIKDFDDKTKKAFEDLMQAFHDKGFTIKALVYSARQEDGVLEMAILNEEDAKTFFNE